MRVVLAWAALNAGLALLLTLWWQDTLSNALLWSAVAGAVLLAAVAWRPRERARALPESSVGVVLLAIGITGLGVSVAVGEWEVYLAALVTAVGVATVARELAEQRRRR